MTVALDNTNAITFFWSFLKMIRVDVLEKFIVPGLGVSYWDLVLGLAIAAIMITVLVSGVRIGIVNGGGFSYSRSDKPSLGSDASANRAKHQAGGGSGIWIKR